jgi:leader peptidase (prepilin peptidase)/N-methyltransferase
MIHLTAIDLMRILLGAALIYLAYIDLRTFRLPDVITIPLVILGLCFNGLANPAFADPINALLGAILGFTFLWSINYFYRIAKKKDGIGMGDAKLLAALGAWFGWHALPVILFIAALSGLIGGTIWLYWNKQDYQKAFPFGPFLAFAGIIELIWPKFLQTLLMSSPI